MSVLGIIASLAIICLKPILSLILGLFSQSNNADDWIAEPIFVFSDWSYS